MHMHHFFSRPRSAPRAIAHPTPMMSGRARLQQHLAARRKPMHGLGCDNYAQGEYVRTGDYVEVGDYATMSTVTALLPWAALAGLLYFMWPKGDRGHIRSAR